MKFTGKNLGFAALVCGLALGGGITTASAQGNEPAPRYEMRPYVQQLTPEQQAQAQAIFDQTMASTNSVRQALNFKRNELDQELASPNPDGNKIERLSREIGELRGKLLSARANARAQLAQQGLPPNCMGPMGGWGAYNGQRSGWNGDYHHRGWRRHGGHRGGHWNDYMGMGMGMMGGSY